MEPEGFDPFNTRAKTAFSALGSIAGLETIGVVSALCDAEEVSDIVSALRLKRVIVTGRRSPPRPGDDVAAVFDARGTPTLLGRPPWWQRLAGRVRSALRGAGS